MGKTRFNASSLSPPRSQYQLNWTNGIGDISCLCINWLKYFTIRQQWHSESRVCWSMSSFRPSWLLLCFYGEKPAKRSPKPKQIGTSDYCRTCGCFVYLNSTGQSIRSRKATENLFLRVFVSVLITKRKSRFKRPWFYRFANRRSVK